MKIFRTDGSGTVNKPERLLKVIGKIIDKVGLTNGLIDNIESIEDKKGLLTVSLKKPFANDLDETYLLYLFIVEWVKFGESSDDVVIYSY